MKGRGTQKSCFCPPPPSPSPLPTGRQASKGEGCPYNYGLINKWKDLTTVPWAPPKPIVCLKAFARMVIHLIEPEKGRVVPAGSTFTIRWNAKAEAEKFRLLYSLNNGSSWKTVHPETQFVTGLSYNWTVPTPPKTKKNCLTKVIAYTEEETKVGADSSDKPFSIQVP